MSNMRNAQDAEKESHSVSLKVLRLSRPALAPQYSVHSPLASSLARPVPIAASLAFKSLDEGSSNPAPFLLSPIATLPPSFGPAYVGETFSCMLCANRDFAGTSEVEGLPKEKTVHDVRIQAEMKTPSSTIATKLSLLPEPAANSDACSIEDQETLQQVVSFQLKEEGNHVLAVTVSYYESTDVSGRTRTFRKLYQFMCKSSLVVRTKLGSLPARREGRRRWVLEAQLENCTDDAILLDRVVLSPDPTLASRACNWDIDARGKRQKPVLRPSEVHQVFFVVDEQSIEKAEVMQSGKDTTSIGELGIAWRAEIASGFLQMASLTASE